MCPANWHSLTVCRAALFHSIWPIRKGKVKIVRFQLKWTFKWKFSDTCYIPPPPKSNIKATGGEKKDKSRHKCKYTLFLSIFSFSSFTLYIEQFFHLNSFLRKKNNLPLCTHIHMRKKKKKAIITLVIHINICYSGQSLTFPPPIMLNINAFLRCSGSS